MGRPMVDILLIYTMYYGKYKKKVKQRYFTKNALKYVLISLQYSLKNKGSNTVFLL